MESVGFVEKLEAGEPERNLKFAYMISRWLGVFAYLNGIWIGGFSTVSIAATILNSRPLDLNFVLNGIVTASTAGTSVFALIVIMKGDLLLERRVMLLVAFGLIASTIIYTFTNVIDIWSGVVLSPLGGISGAIITGLVMYLIVRFFYIGRTLRSHRANRNLVDRLEALEA